MSVNIFTQHGNILKETPINYTSVGHCRLQFPISANETNLNDEVSNLHSVMFKRERQENA